MPIARPVHQEAHNGTGITKAYLVVVKDPPFVEFKHHKKDGEFNKKLHII